VHSEESFFSVDSTLVSANAEKVRGFANWQAKTSQHPICFIWEHLLMANQMRCPKISSIKQQQQQQQEEHLSSYLQLH
jgi:hypothetical protein